MARLCEWIYREDADGWPVTSPPLIGEKIIRIEWLGDQKQSTQGAAIVTAEKIYIVFRGSQSLLGTAGLKDWIQNIKARRVEHFGIKAHRGYASAAIPLIRPVRAILDKYKSRDIEIGGHSAGGGIAVALAVAINNKLRLDYSARPLKIITLGQPRISSRRLLNLALQFVPYIRIQNGSDIVVGLPRAIGYSHAGTNLYIAHNGEIIINPSAWRKFKDRILTVTQRATDHKTKDYLNNLVKGSK